MKEHANKTEEAASFLAAESVEHVVGGTAGRVGGMAIQPVLWAVKGGDGPDGLDVGLWVAGAVPMLKYPALATSVIRAAVKDVTEQLLAEVRAAEPAHKRRHIKAAADYSGLVGAYINSMTIASKGGTAWLHKNGLWVYITDSKGRLVSDYQPSRVNTLRILQPILPLQAVSSGSFRWHQL